MAEHILDENIQTLTKQVAIDYPRYDISMKNESLALLKSIMETGQTPQTAPQDTPMEEAFIDEVDESLSKYTSNDIFFEYGLGQVNRGLAKTTTDQKVPGHNSHMQRHNDKNNSQAGIGKADEWYGDESLLVPSKSFDQEQFDQEFKKQSRDRMPRKDSVILPQSQLNKQAAHAEWRNMTLAHANDMNWKQFMSSPRTKEEIADWKTFSKQAISGKGIGEEGIGEADQTILKLAGVYK
jgi:hypothetical protein